MAFGQQDNNEEFHGHLLWWSWSHAAVVSSRGLEKKIIDISKVWYSRCIRTMDRVA